MGGGWIGWGVSLAAYDTLAPCRYAGDGLFRCASVDLDALVGGGLVYFLVANFIVRGIIFLAFGKGVWECHAATRGMTCFAALRLIWMLRWGVGWFIFWLRILLCAASFSSSLARGMAVPCRYGEALASLGLA
jgi:hypothetical protein